jgi:heme/copper-type cytochrome/quinol oxidase subunit 2
MKRIPLANKAVALPLLGLLAAWVAFMGAVLVDLYVPQPTYDSMGNATFPEEIFHVAPYLFLLGISAGAICSRIGQQLALKARAQLGDDNKLARAAYRFATLGVIIGLGAGAIFAIGNFMSAFNTYSGRAENLGLRLLNVYVPILLATALVVYVLLSAFVFRHDGVKNTDGEKARMSEVQKALALGYAIPILATAIAIILGLVVYDITRTNLQIWVWVIIISIVASGVVLGTRFANKARTAKPEKPKPKTALAAGAASLNFVLSIVFGASVSIMAFSFGAEAISKLRVWPEIPADCKFSECNPVPTLASPSWQWLIEEMAPAKVLLLLAVVGIYLTITERNKEAK